MSDILLKQSDIFLRKVILWTSSQWYYIRLCNIQLPKAIHANPQTSFLASGNPYHYAVISLRSNRTRQQANITEKPQLKVQLRFFLAERLERKTTPFCKCFIHNPRYKRRLNLYEKFQFQIFRIQKCQAKICQQKMYHIQIVQWSFSQNWTAQAPILLLLFRGAYNFSQPIQKTCNRSRYRRT